VPNNSLVKTAREGLKPPAPTTAAPDLKLLPAGRKPFTAQTVPSLGSLPGGLPALLQDEFDWSLCRSETASSMMQQWFGRQSAASRVSIGIFAAVLLGLMGMRYWFPKDHPAPRVAPTGPSAQAPVPPPPPPPAANADGPATVQTRRPSQSRRSPPDPSQLSWLPSEGRTFVFVTANPAHFDLPLDSVAPF